MSEGTCRLAFGVAEGGGDLGTLDVPYYLVSGSDALARDQAAGDPCAVQNQQVCSRGRSSLLVCQSKRWAVSSACAPGICDYTAPAGAAACR